MAAAGADWRIEWVAPGERETMVGRRRTRQLATVGGDQSAGGIAARAVDGRLREFVLVAAPAAIGDSFSISPREDPLSG